ncbi:MAG: hypothetical protein QG657_5432 [Acidobacteriota bacterium]|nr:hypothetical protein [Acidobacteriota bacterium]
MRFTNKFFASYLQIIGGIFEKIKIYLDFLAIIAGYGYNDARIQEGKAFYDELYSCHHLYLEKRQETLSRMKAADEMFKKVLAKHSNHVKRLRSELRNDLETKTLLGIRGSRDRSKRGFYDQANNFYNLAMKPENFVKVQGFGFTMEELSSTQQEIKSYYSFRIGYETMKGELQELVEKRFQAYVKLRDWMAGFITACKVAYAGKLQTLEKFGIFVLNRPRIHEEEEVPEEVPGVAAAPVAPATPSAPAASSAPAAPIAEENNAAQVTQVSPVSEPAN